MRKTVICFLIGMGWVASIEADENINDQDLTSPQKTTMSPSSGGPSKGSPEPQEEGGWTIIENPHLEQGGWVIIEHDDTMFDEKPSEGYFNFREYNKNPIILALQEVAFESYKFLKREIAPAACSLRWAVSKGCEFITKPEVVKTMSGLLGLFIGASYIYTRTNLSEFFIEELEKLFSGKDSVLVPQNEFEFNAWKNQNALLDIFSGSDDIPDYLKSIAKQYLDKSRFNIRNM